PLLYTHRPSERIPVRMGCEPHHGPPSLDLAHELGDAAQLALDRRTNRRANAPPEHFRGSGVREGCAIRLQRCGAVEGMHALPMSPLASIRRRPARCPGSYSHPPRFVGRPRCNSTSLLRLRSIECNVGPAAVASIRAMRSALAALTYTRHSRASEISIASSTLQHGARARGFHARRAKCRHSAPPKRRITEATA